MMVLDERKYVKAVKPVFNIYNNKKCFLSIKSEY